MGPPVRRWAAMGDTGIPTYEAEPAGLRLVGRHASLAASSADLPAGAYTTLRTYGGRGLVRLDQHLRRLEESAALQGQAGTIDPSAARRAVTLALDATANPESRLRLTFAPPRLFVAVEPFTPLPRRLYEQGVACVTLDVRRQNPHSKDTRFIAAAQAAYGRLPAGVEEGLLVGEDGAHPRGALEQLLRRRRRRAANRGGARAHRRDPLARARGRGGPRARRAPRGPDLDDLPQRRRGLRHERLAGGPAGRPDRRPAGGRRRRRPHDPRDHGRLRRPREP